MPVVNISLRFIISPLASVLFLDYPALEAYHIFPHEYIWIKVLWSLKDGEVEWCGALVCGETV
jgi:hypothetical protein